MERPGDMLRPRADPMNVKLLSPYAKPDEVAKSDIVNNPKFKETD